MQIGIDLDNTIICYDPVFYETALARGLVTSTFHGTKQAVRDAIRDLPNGEAAWTALQADVYGLLIGNAMPFPGVMNFIQTAVAGGHHIVIISHKTSFAAARPNGMNLRDAARDWLAAHGFFNSPISMTMRDVYFCDSRKEKCQRISACNVDVFIDDLIEVFNEPDFPERVDKILFQDQSGPSLPDVRRFSTWEAIDRAVLG